MQRRTVEGRRMLATTLRSDTNAARTWDDELIRPVAAGVRTSLVMTLPMAKS